MEVTPGNMPDGEGHCQHGKAEGERNTQRPDAHRGKGGRQDGAATPTQNQPKCSDKPRCNLFHAAPPSKKYPPCAAKNPTLEVVAFTIACFDITAVPPLFGPPKLEGMEAKGNGVDATEAARPGLVAWRK